MKKILFSVFLTLCMVNSLPAVVVTTIEQLDELAATNGGFSFSIMGDNNGYAAYNYNSLGDATAIGMARLEPWIKDNDEFCLAVGDHAIGTRKYWYTMNETDPFWHNHYYPSLGDNCNGTDYFYGSTADQAIWGRGWVMFKALNNFFTRSNETEQIIFRQPDTNNPVYSSVSKANPDTLVPYPDQLCDYYVKRKQGNFTFHIISVNVPDPGVLAARSKDFMMNKLYELAAIKTDYDIIVVLAQKNNWLKRAQDKGWISRAERDAFMSIVDLTVNGDDHIYRRQNNFDADYNRTEALWMNSGAPASTGALWGYLNVHVFDNPPRFVVQYIDVQNQSTRKLHVNPVKKSSTQQAQPDADTKPIMKYVNGPYVSVDWNNFPMEPVANDAAFVSQTVPTVLNAGETTTVHVVMKNLGTNLWSTAAGHKLGTQTNVWTVTNRVALTNTVGEWADHTFTFNIIAPTTPGYYDFQWQMVDDLGADAGWFGPVTPVVSINVRTVEQVEHGTVLLRVDLHQNTGDTVPVTPAGFVGWKIGDVSSGVQAPGTNINGYGLTLGSGTSIACLTSASSQKGMNSRNRSTGYITNAGAFTQADMMRERVASADTPTAPSTGNGTG
ncbi:MAG: hypothetical protein FJ220_03045, partial [Kiritimatiellaceae bacterium]|nr:hypothetical protein [Kiritimatiellaceae bacterium]